MKWRKSLGELPDEALTWQPFTNGPSIGGLILHLTACEAFWLGQVAANKPTNNDDPAIAFDNEVDQYAPFWPIPPAQPLTWYYSIQDEQRQRSWDWVKAQPNPKYEIVGPDYGVTYRWIVSHLLQHDSYHGGQAVLLYEMWKKINSPAK